MDLSRRVSSDVSRVAVLVDGDNIAPRHGGPILDLGAGLGRVDVARAYVDTQHLESWLAVPGLRLCHAGTGKNAADMALSVDAVELALSGGFGTFVVASSDGDFTVLAQKLRELGRRVVGAGTDKAPERFRAACSDFVVLAGAPAPEAGVAPAAACTELDRKIRAMIARHSEKGLGMRICDLGLQMGAEHGVQIRTFPEKEWRRYLAARPALYDLDARGPEARVRFLPAGFAATA